MKRRYSDGDKAMALATLDANEGDVRKTAKLLNIPGSTLTDWSKNRGTNWEIAEIRAVKKLELSEKLEKVAHALVDNILIRAESDLSVLVPLKDFAVTLGIAIDKMQLLRGQATAITQTSAKASQSLTELIFERTGERLSDEQAERIMAASVQRAKIKGVA